MQSRKYKGTDIFNPKLWKVFRKTEDQLGYEIFGEAPYLPVYLKFDNSTIFYTNEQFVVKEIFVIFQGKLYLIPNSDVDFEARWIKVTKSDWKKIKEVGVLKYLLDNLLFKLTDNDSEIRIYDSVLKKPLSSYQIKGRLFTWFLIKVLKFRIK